jgi:hypothetical protein
MPNGRFWPAAALAERPVWGIIIQRQLYGIKKSELSCTHDPVCQSLFRNAEIQDSGQGATRLRDVRVDEGWA